MSGEQYVEPWILQQQAEYMANTPEALASRKAAEEARAKELAQEAFKQQQPTSGWFNTDSSPFGRGPRKGGRRTKSRKSRRTRRYRK